MDIAGLLEEFENLVEAGDFAGAEDLLLANLGAKHEAFLHLQLGRLYIRWNKMTSAVQHLGRATEVSRDEIMTAQIIQELRRARRLQLEQTP